MGTKIQCKTYLPAFYSVKDLNGHVNNRVPLLNHEEQTLRSVQHFDFFASCVPVDGYFEYDKEKVRQTILKHESIFRHQLQELHRLHRRQMELMSELKTRELQKNSMKAETLHFGHFLSHAPPSDVKRAWSVSYFPSPSSGSALVSTSGTSYSQSPFEFIKGENRASRFSSQDKEIPRAGNEDRYNSNTTTLEFSKRTNRLADLNEPIFLEEAPILASNANPYRINSLADSIESMDKLSRNHIIRRNGGNGFNHMQFNHMQSVSGRNGQEHLIIDINADAHSDSSHTPFPSNNTKAEHPKKRTIFGVVISEGNEERSMTVSSGSCKGVKQNLDCNGGKVHMNGDIRMTSSSKGDGASRSLQLNAREVNGCSSVGFNYANGKSVMAMKVDTEKPVISQNVAYCQTKRESSKGALPWFMVKSQHGLDQSKEGENYCHTNLDLLKNCSQQIFRKSETDEGFSRILNRRQEAKPSTSIKDSEHSNIEVSSATAVKKIFGVPIFKSSKDVVNSADSLSRASFLDVHGVNSKNVFADDTASKNQFDSIEKRLDNNISGLSPQIDLNLSLDEEEVSPTPSLPRAVVEIELDDEAPALLESEGVLSLEAESRDIKSGLEEFKEPRGEAARRAAEAIVSLSQTGDNSFLDSLYNKNSESAATACLEWFAELITSEVNGDECRIMEASSGKQRGNSSDEDSIPDGMDYFEFATLKLRDMKEEGQCYEPSILEIHNDDEEEEIGAATTQSKRPRRGQARRGRQRKDFQRDVLPGIMSLSKHELSEDILTFEELLRTSGCSWQSCLSQKKAAKTGRGRRRRGGSTTPSPIKTATPSNQPLCNEVEIEKASLTGWGKKTRRLPRQRCPTTHHVPLMQC